MTIGRIFAISALCFGAALSVPAAAQAPAGAALRGSALFQQRCAACHSVAPGKTGVGPNLSGVVGRRAGSAAFNYSPAMKRAAVIWDAQNLDSYLAAPLRRIPGSRMPINVPRADERQSIIAFLRSK